METLTRQIRRAQRRLVLEQFLHRLTRCWSAAFMLALIAVSVRKLWAFSVPGSTWSLAWMAGALAAGLLAAACWTLWRRRSAEDAALEIDRRFGLKERVSSSLALSPHDLASEAGQALVEDATRRVDRIDVGAGFALRPGGWSLLPAIPAILAGLLAWFVADKASDRPAQAATTADASLQVQASTKTLEKKFEKRREEARAKGLEDAADLFKKLEQGTKELAGKDDVDRKQALVKLNDLAKQIDERRDKLAAQQRLKEQFKGLKDMGPGPADKLAKSLKNGAFAAAAKELEKLKQRLADKQLNDKDQQQLAQQLKQMQEALEHLADKHQQAKQELEQQIAEQRQAGNTADADKLQKQLDKLCQNCPDATHMAGLSRQLKQAAQALKDGKPQAAQQALDQLSSELDSLKQGDDELAMIDQALDEMADAKNAMGCKDCKGQGCKQCQGGGQGQKRGQQPGNGLGRGRGQGSRPEQDNKTSFYDSNVRQNVGRGGAVVSGLVDGPSRKGDVHEQIKASFESARQEAADPLTGQRLPRDYRDHARSYFDAVRDGDR